MLAIPEAPIGLQSSAILVARVFVDDAWGVSQRMLVTSSLRCPRLQTRPSRLAYTVRVSSPVPADGLCGPESFAEVERQAVRLAVLQNQV